MKSRASARAGNAKTVKRGENIDRRSPPSQEQSSQSISFVAFEPDLPTKYSCLAALLSADSLFRSRFAPDPATQAQAAASM
jgi:hypothetical protein